MNLLTLFYLAGAVLYGAGLLYSWISCRAEDRADILITAGSASFLLFALVAGTICWPVVWPLVAWRSRGKRKSK